MHHVKPQEIRLSQLLVCATCHSGLDICLSFGFVGIIMVVKVEIGSAYHQVDVATEYVVLRQLTPRKMRVGKQTKERSSCSVSSAVAPSKCVVRQ